MKTALSHAELVALAMKWLRGARRHAVVLCETKTLVTDEEPDVIGWRGNGFATVCEVKVSRADFHADKKKHFRADPTAGMGYERWYFTPPGLLIPDDLPPNWGLAESGRAIRVVVSPKPFYEHNLRAEKALLVSALRRATEGWGQKIFGDLAQTEALHPAREKRLAKLERKYRTSRIALLAEEPELAIDDPRRTFEAAFPKLPKRPSA